MQRDTIVNGMGYLIISAAVGDTATRILRNGAEWRGMARFRFEIFRIPCRTAHRNARRDAQPIAHIIAHNYDLSFQHPLQRLKRLVRLAMASLLGDLWQNGEPDWAAAMAIPEVKLHPYGKQDARPGRKMGHLTATADTREEAVE